MSKQIKGILLAACGASFWGGSGAAAQYLFTNTSITTAWLVAIRLLIAGLLMTGISWMRSSQQVKGILCDRHNLIILFVFAILGMLNSQFTYFLAVAHSNAPTATVIQYLQPVFIIIWLAFREHQWSRRVDFISIIIAIIGTFLLATGGHLGQLALTPAAIFWGITCALAVAMYTLLPRLLLAQFDALTGCGLAILICRIGLLPELLFHPLPALKVSDWGLIVYIIIFGTMFSYSMFLQSMKYISASVTGMLSAFEPLVATILAVDFLGTKLTSATIIGSLLILFTTVLQSIPLKRIKEISLQHFKRNKIK